MTAYDIASGRIKVEEPTVDQQLKELVQLRQYQEWLAQPTTQNLLTYIDKQIDNITAAAYASALNGDKESSYKFSIRAAQIHFIKQFIKGKE